MATNLGRIGFVPKGNHVDLGAYKFLDVVRYQGAAYACMVANTTNNPSNATDWMLLNSDGTSGQVFKHTGLWIDKPVNGTGLTAYIDRIFITDIGIGGSEWYWDGSRYRAAGGQVILKSLANSAAFPSLVMTASDVSFGLPLTIPAGAMLGGDIVQLEVTAVITAGTAVTPNFKFFVNNARLSQHNPSSLTAGASGVVNKATFMTGARLSTDTTAHPVNVGSSSGYGVSSTASETTGITIPSSISNPVVFDLKGSVVSTFEIRSYTFTLKTCG